MRLPTLKYLRTFQFAARFGSFRAAADELCITPSAVSHQIRGLEDQLGIALFERTPQALRLTAAGERYFAAIDHSFGQLEGATGQLLDHFGRSLVRVQVPAMFASELFLPRLYAFQASQPDTDIRIETMLPGQAPSFGNTDLAIVVNASPGERHGGELLFEQRLVPACAPGFAEQHGLKEATHLDGLPLVTIRGREHDWDTLATHLGVPRFRPRKLVHIDSMTQAARAAEQGLGVALLGWPLCTALVDEGALVTLLGDGIPSGESYWLVSGLEGTLTEETRGFRDWVLREFRAP